MATPEDTLTTEELATELASIEGDYNDTETAPDPEPASHAPRTDH